MKIKMRGIEKRDVNKSPSEDIGKNHNQYVN